MQSVHVCNREPKLQCFYSSFIIYCTYSDTGPMLQVQYMYYDTVAVVPVHVLGTRTCICSLLFIVVCLSTAMPATCQSEL